MIGHTRRDFCAFTEQRYDLPLFTQILISREAKRPQADRDSTPVIEPERNVFGKHRRLDVSACEIRNIKYENTSPKRMGEVSDFVSPPQAISSQDQRLRCAHRVISAPIRLHVVCDAETAERQKKFGSVVLLRTF